MLFFFNDTATTEIYTLSLHDALPICHLRGAFVVLARDPLAAHDREPQCGEVVRADLHVADRHAGARTPGRRRRSEEHTSELQSRQYLVCRLLLEKKKKTIRPYVPPLD